MTQNKVVQVVVDSIPPEIPATDNWGTPWNFSWLENPEWSRASAPGDAGHGSEQKRRGFPERAQFAPVITAFRRIFEIDERRTIRIHVSGDQRYSLYLDGERIAFGPERGTNDNWFLTTLDITFAAGRHTLVALVSWTRAGDGLSHIGHASNSPAFALYAPDAKDLLSTGHAEWMYTTVPGYTLDIPAFEGTFSCVGGRTNIDTRVVDPSFVTSGSKAIKWTPCKMFSVAQTNEFFVNEITWTRTLRPAMLPAMFQGVSKCGAVRHAMPIDPDANQNRIMYDEARSDQFLASEFQRMLDGEGGFEAPANAKLQFLVDFRDYFCAWPVLAMDKGKDAKVSLEFAESLFGAAKLERGTPKGNRDVIQGKYFFGMGDSFIANGRKLRDLEPIWWEAGRYMRVTVETRDEPLVIDSLVFRETHYPHKFVSEFRCDDARWDHVLKISKRVLEMCSHETYFDCPYYEQLMYGGDTRLEILTTYATTPDDSLPKKAMFMFDASRLNSGLTCSRTPSIPKQVIPPFSLWWIMMVHDYAYWRDDPAFVKARMRGVRTVLDAFIENLDESHVLHPIKGWNFVDWVPGWVGGMPTRADGISCATIMLQLAYVMKCAAELEREFGDSFMAERYEAISAKVTEASRKTFWMPEKRLFAEDGARTFFSEHAQCMAVLANPSEKEFEPALSNSSSELAKTTIYYSFYLFEAYRLLGKPNEIYERLRTWFDLESIGLCTTLEQPEPSRSDAHAWGAHPMFHALATFAGIRPSSFGFKSAEIRPQFGPLNEIHAKLVHPHGFITLDAARDASGAIHGTASAPDGVPCTLALPGAAPIPFTSALSF